MSQRALISFVLAAAAVSAFSQSDGGDSFVLPGIPGELQWSNDPLDWSVEDGALVITVEDLRNGE